MKKMNTMQMEGLQGGARPTGTQVACWAASVAYVLSFTRLFSLYFRKR